MTFQTGADCNFAYVLTGKENGDKILVLPISIQMGWTISPAYLCTATETPGEVEEHYRNAQVVMPPPHPMERKTMPPNGINRMPDIDVNDRVITLFSPW